jgi:type II secretory ATPase GspE/PulE/Tfp pilus assembly ATPase PilB-like protein
MARAQGVASLRDDGLRLVRAGGTTVAELARVLSAGEDG